jgi:menaquinone-dependent protoporphyrinogen oxidase
MDIFYATHDGHTGVIAVYLAALLRLRGVEADARNLAYAAPSEAEIQTADPCVLIGAIRYGFHLSPATRLLKRLAPLTPQKPVVLLSVNLTARKPGKHSAATNVYLRKWIRRAGVTPILTEALGGKLDYPRYSWFDRTMIRLIMTITGGPTDPKAIVDYTPWARLETLADEIAALDLASQASLATAESL